MKKKKKILRKILKKEKKSPSTEKFLDYSLQNRKDKREK